MTTDPAVYIIAAAILGACIGFFGCALFASSQIRRANRDGYAEALRHLRSREDEKSTIHNP
jgi:hypothetical protein